MIILGLNAFHADSAACIVRDGKLVAAAEEERFRRIKHWAGFPSQAIAYCLQEAGLGLGDIDHIAVNQDSSAQRWRKLTYLWRTHPNPGLVFARLKNRRARARLMERLAALEPGKALRARLHYVEHHLAHLSSAFRVSPFAKAVVVSLDGFGDFASSAWGIGVSGDITIDGRIFFPHSLGIFYEALTRYLGFPHYGDEYKVMGLAPYGNPIYRERLRQVVHLQPGGLFELDLRYFHHHITALSYRWNDTEPSADQLFSSALEDLLGPCREPGEPLSQRHRDIARSTQAVYEEAFFHLIGSLHRRYDLTDIALAGGCALNSVANGKIRQVTPFRRVYVQAAAGDAGGAVGAAFTVWHELGGARTFVMNHAYWGPSFDNAEILRLIEMRRSDLTGCAVVTLEDENELCRRAASAIAAGKVVGWFQGRMEWGPRALGNRSILCDPRRSDIKSVLNNRIKHRENFRPFAPSVLEDAVATWFEEEDAVPFMTQVFQIRDEKRAQIPAVIHIDGSSRLQTVHRHTNPRYYRLIEVFRDLTGVPLLLNTSFNENEPIVCRPEEALDCFLRTRMDMLVIGDIIISRRQ
jgi:carbamoyltransferase